MSVTRGFGGVVRTPRSVAAAAPTVTGARNGLSLVGNDVELGGNPLLHNTSFDQAGFDFEIFNGAIPQFQIDPTNRFYMLGDGGAGAGLGLRLTIDDIVRQFQFCDAAGFAFMFIDLFSEYFSFGDAFGLFPNSAFIELFSPGASITTQNGGIMLGDQSSGLYQFGDGDITGNGSFFQILDSSERFLFISGAASDEYLDFNPGSQYFNYGDLSNAANGARVRLNDLQEFFEVQLTGNPVMNLDQASGFYNVGDLGPSGNGVSVLMNDPTNSIQLQANGIVLGNTGGTDSYLELIQNLQQLHFVSQGNTLLNIDQATGLYDFGPSGSGNGCFLRINDGTNRFIIDNTASNMVVNMNGVDGFTGTVAAPASITVNGGIVTAVS